MSSTRKVRTSNAASRSCGSIRVRSSSRSISPSRRWRGMRRNCRTRRSSSSGTRPCSRRTRSRSKTSTRRTRRSKQLQGTVESDRAAVSTARLDLSYSTVQAPISGRVGLRPVDIGNYVTTSDTSGIATITQVTPIDVVFITMYAGTAGGHGDRLYVVSGNGDYGSIRDIGGIRPDQHRRHHRPEGRRRPGALARFPAIDGQALRHHGRSPLPHRSRAWRSRSPSPPRRCDAHHR